MFDVSAANCFLLSKLIDVHKKCLNDNSVRIVILQQGMGSIRFDTQYVSSAVRRARSPMERRSLLVAAFLVTIQATELPAEPVAVRHIQRPMHRSMVARSDTGAVIATGDFTQVVQGDEVTMHLTYSFVDGSIDDETTTYRQQGAFRLLRYHHLQKGPFFTKPVDFTVEAPTRTMSFRTVDKRGRIQVEIKHMDLPDDLANGFVGTLLLNVPHNTQPFRVGMLAPVGGGRLVPLLISPDSQQTVLLRGQTFKATVFRVHPELGGFVRVIARMLGLQPKDVLVWVLEGDEPAVAVVIGQLGGYGPVISSDLVGSSIEK
jgi:hypothetical protein